MGERVRRLVVLYDRDCTFCNWVVRQLRRIDRARRLEFVALQDAESGHAGSRLAALAHRHPLADALHTLEMDGAVQVGGDALVDIFRRLPGGALVGAWARLPGAMGLARAVYRVAAANRGALGSLLVASGANCDVPTTARSAVPRDTPGTAASGGAGGER